MSGVGSLLSIARGALLTHETAMQVTSQNIANAENPGYSRQIAVVETNPSANFVYGNVGTGVHVATVTRQRDILLDARYREDSSSAGKFGLREDLLGQLQGIFGEPSDSGLSATMDAFWSSWADLANSPNSGSARVSVQQRGQQVATMLNSFNTRLSDAHRSTLPRIQNAIAEINQTASTVAELNGQIMGAEVGGHSANDLRDKRDMLLDKLASMGGSSVIERLDGSVQVMLGSITLVDGTTARHLAVAPNPPVPPPATPVVDMPLKITALGSSEPLQYVGGQLGATLTIANTDIPGLRQRLDALAASLVQGVNAVHATGFVFPGGATPGVAAGNFFQAPPAGTVITAANIALDMSATGAGSSPTNVAASGVIGGPLDNTLALAMSRLRTATASVTYPAGASPQSYADFYRDTVTVLGLQTSQAHDDASVYSTLADQSDTRRKSVSGVATDEELVQLMRHQAAYAAASKLVSAADEMLKTLINMT